MPKRLLIAAAADRVLVKRAQADRRFEVVDHPVRTEDELAAIVGDCEILVTRSYNRVTRRVIDAAPRLELIAQGTSGTDNIDAAAAACGTATTAPRATSCATTASALSAWDRWGAGWRTTRPRSG